MKRSVAAVFLFFLAFPLVGGPGPQGPKKKVPCKASLAECPDEGCGTQFDPKVVDAFVKTMRKEGMPKRQKHAV